MITTIEKTFDRMDEDHPNSPGILWPEQGRG